jgi:chromosome segregation and condensation protein ScpB
LEQAALVAVAKNVDLSKLSKWAKIEGKAMSQALKELKLKIKFV